MPELPEMENYRIQISQKLSGKTITDVEVNREKSINIPVNSFKDNIVNKQLVSVERRAKHLIFQLSSGNALLLHLMLGGWMYLGNNEDAPDRTKQVILKFGDKSLYFIGLRLGYLHFLTQAELQKDFADLGPEPLSNNFTEQTLLQILKGKTGALKTTLVDQHVIAGIGNRYSDEICFAAGLKPTHTCNDLSEQDYKNLFQAIKSVLQKAVTEGGYMDEPLYKGDNLTGSYNTSMMVYKREGEACIRCGTKIIQDKISSRKTFYCPNCQH